MFRLYRVCPSIICSSTYCSDNNGIVFLLCILYIAEVVVLRFATGLFKCKYSLAFNDYRPLSNPERTIVIKTINTINNICSNEYG